MINYDKYKDFYHFLPFFTTLLKTFTPLLQVIEFLYVTEKEIEFDKINRTNEEKISTLMQNI
jgi:hypothetical protein